MKKLNQSGIAHLGLVLLVAVSVAAVGFIGYNVYQRNDSHASTASQQQLAALTEVINKLKAGKEAAITAKPVAVPGPVSTAQARPIVFTVKGRGTYFAYRQGVAPNFNQSAAKVARSMAISPATVNKGTSAHLNKKNVLVDGNSTSSLVGYSVGGDKTGKTPQSAPQPTPTPSTPAADTDQQKLAALISVIDAAKQGGEVGITSTAIPVPGPITTAQARPIVFGVKGGGLYFAYRQDQAPDFNQSSEATAKSMAIIAVNVKYTLESAHLSKVNVLVDASSMSDMVGYSVSPAGSHK